MQWRCEADILTISSPSVYNLFSGKYGVGIAKLLPDGGDTPGGETSPNPKERRSL
jgi:hypothetical protein